jgi:protein tyrosine/serine phosphatase
MSTKTGWFGALIFILLFSAQGMAQYTDEQIPEYHQVNTNLLRGGRPQAGDLAALAHQNIKTIINLENDPTAVAAEKDEAIKLGLNFISSPMSGFWKPHDSQVENILEKLADPSLFPIYIHCKHGQDRTGVIIGLYRVRYDQWSAEKAYDEMRAYGFHPALFLLDAYYKKKSGYQDPD